MPKLRGARSEAATPRRTRAEGASRPSGDTGSQDRIQDRVDITAQTWTVYRRRRVATVADSEHKDEMIILNVVDDPVVPRSRLRIDDGSNSLASSGQEHGFVAGPSTVDDRGKLVAGGFTTAC